MPEVNHMVWRILLGLRLDNLVRTCGIIETQRKTIELAGKGDIKRFFDSIEEKRRQLRTAKGEGEIDRIRTELSACARSLDDGLFDERSFFHKMMKRTLSQDQVARYQADRREARVFRHRALVAAAVRIFDRALGLDDAQRRTLTNLLLSETRAPKIAADHRAECLFVLAQSVNVPKSKLGPIFTNVQHELANPFIEKLKEGLAGELKDFEAAEKEAATKADANFADETLSTGGEVPKSAPITNDK